VNKNSFFKRVSGEKALSLSAFLIFLPFGVLGVAIIIPIEETAIVDRFNWLLIGIIAQSVMAIVVVIFNSIYQKFFKGSKFSLLYVIVALFISGAVRGLAIGQAAPLVDLADSLAPLIRAINSAITSVIWLGIIGLMLEAQASYIREHQDLYQRFLMLKSGRLPDGRALNSGRLSEIAEQVAQMTSPVRSKLAKLSEGSFTDAQVREAVEDLQKVVKEQIRPLSHRLWFDRKSHLLRFKISNLLLDAFKTDEIPIIFFTALTTFSMFVGITVSMGIGISSRVSIIFGLSIFILLGLEKFILKIKKIKSYLVHPIFLILISILPLVFTHVYFYFSDIAAWSEYANFGVAGSIFITAILTTMLAQSLIDRAKIIDILTAQITSGYVEEHLHAIARMAEDSEIASYLHSSLQSELTAVALKLDQAAKSGNRDEVKSIIQYAQIVMERDLSINFHAGEHSPLERINALLDAWRGIAEIKIELVGIELCETQVVTDISQIIEEAVSDSVRFGNANSISINGSASPDHYYFKVTDNGKSKPNSGSGLGTILLDEIAPNLWRREFALEGTNLEVWIPLKR
jgi:signal transduction histidine kinase